MCVESHAKSYLTTLITFGDFLEVLQILYSLNIILGENDLPILIRSNYGTTN